MQTVASKNELQEAIQHGRDAGYPIAFVPTMGALHDGHLSLIREARRHTPFVVVSIFVNPLQFSAGEDFEDYPRTLQTDAAKLEAIGVNVLFAPTVNDVYQGNMTINQHAGPIGSVLEGAARPDHFDGMLTVVSRLFDLVKPDFAIFGAKDAQQVFLVKQMVARSYPNLEIITAPTIREESGLALSSRNAYLSENEHQVAQHLYAALTLGKLGATSPSAALEMATAAMAKVPEAKLDYIALVDANTFENVSDGFSGQALMLIAAVVGQTRLIDNLEITF